MSPYLQNCGAALAFTLSTSQSTTLCRVRGEGREGDELKD